MQKRSFFSQWRLSKKYVPRNFVKHNWHSSLRSRETSCDNVGSMCRTQDRRFALAPRRVHEYSSVHWIDFRRSGGIVFRRYKNGLRAECSRDAYGTNAQNFDTSKTYLRSGRSFWRAVDGGSGPISVSGDARRSYRSPSECSSTRARPVVWRALPAESRPPLSREGIVSFKVHQFVDLSRVVVADIGLRGRTYTCYQRRDRHLVSAVVGGTDSREAPGFRINITKDQFPRVGIFFYLSFYVSSLLYFIF